MTNRGLKELKRYPRGNTYMAAGTVENTKKFGCPPCDTIYLQLGRGKHVHTLCLTPEEGLIVVALLADVLRRLAKGV